MLVEEVDDVGPETLQRCFGHLLDVLGPAVKALPRRGAAGAHVEAELGGDDDPVANGLERLPDQLLVDEGSVDFGRIEERDAKIHCRADHVDHLGALRWRPVGHAHAHAAVTDGRDFKRVRSPAECSYVHADTFRLTG